MLPVIAQVMITLRLDAIGIPLGCRLLDESVIHVWILKNVTGSGLPLAKTRERLRIDTEHILPVVMCAPAD